VGEFGSDHAVLRERAVDRRSGVELHVGAEVVAAGAAFPASAAILLRLDGHSLADSSFRHLFADGDDPARQLMARSDQ
jgi:hypothetical protein